MAGFDPTQVPTAPVEVDWSHPLANGVQGFWLPGLPPPQDLTGRYPSQGLMTVAGATYYPQIGASAIGPAFYSTSPNSPNAYVVNNGPILGGRTEFSILAIVQTTFSAANYGNDIYCERAASGDDIIQLTLSQGNASFTQNSIGFVYRDDAGNIVNVAGDQTVNNGSPHYVGVSCSIDSSTSVLSYSIYIDGILSASGTGTSTTAFTNTGIYSSISGDPQATTAAGYSAAFVGAIPAVGVYDGVLPPSAFALWRSEPFAMLRPVRRRTYFVPASAPSSNIGASLVATSSLSASLRGIGAIRASAAATSQVTSSLKGVGTVGASLAGSSQVSASTLGAGKLGADLLATSALSASTRGAGSLKASLIGSSALSAAAHGVGTIGAHLAATSTLSSGWLVPSTLGASLVATSALSVSFVGAFPILPGRSISVLPSIRFIVAPVPIPIPGLQFRVPTFSPRAPNDVDFFTVDLGETGSSLIGTPAVTVPTGDLTIAGVTVSGSQVTFTVSGPGTPAAYSQLAIAWQTGNGAFSQTFQVLTNGFVAAIPVNSPAGILLPAPFFGSRAPGDVSYFQLDMTGIVPAGAAITSAIVSCPTGDMTVGAVLSTATSVAWEGSGSGTIGQASGFAVQVALSTGAQLTFFAAIETMASP